MLPFPEQHKEITQQLLSGKFILQTEEIYNVISNDKDMYQDFFRKTFDYELVIKADYAFLKSSNEKDKQTRDLLIFIALLCREIDKNGKDFKEEIEKENFSIEDVSNFLTDSSKKKEIIESTSLANNKGEIDLISFLNEWQRRNVVQYVGSNKLKFRFTKAVNLFFDYAVMLANEKLKEAEEVPED